MQHRGGNGGRLGVVHSEMLAARKEGGWTVKSKTAAAGNKEASAGITHLQKLLCSAECMQIVASQMQKTRSFQRLSSPSCSSDTNEHSPARCIKLVFLTGEDRR